MPFNVVASDNAAFATGAALGLGIAQNNLRRQQLESERALQKLQQQQAAEMLSWTMRQHHEAIDKQADDAKRSALFQSMITPTLSVQGPDVPDNFANMDSEGGYTAGNATMPGNMQKVPNPAYTADWGEAYFKAMSGSPYEPLSKVATTAGMLSYHQQQGAAQKALAAQRAAGGGAMDAPFSTVIDPNTGEPVTIFQSGPRTRKIVEGPKALSREGKVMTDYNRALDSGDTATADVLRRVIDSIASPKAQSPEGKLAADYNRALSEGDASTVEMLQPAIDKAKQKGSINAIQGPDGTTYYEYTPSGGKGSPHLVSGAPEVITVGGEQGTRDANGNFHRFPKDPSARMTAFALNKQAQEAPEFSIPNPNAPGLRMIDPAKWDQFAKLKGITTANRTKLEGEEIGAENVFALGKELLPLINENTTGARAELTRFLQRRGLTTLFPGLDNPEISVAETVGRRFSSGFVKAMKSDTNIGVREQESLQHAAETINWTTMASGRARLGAIVAQAADTSRRAALKKGTPINPLFLTKDEIRARLASGDYGDPNSEAAGQAAIEAYNNTADNFLSSIR